MISNISIIRYNNDELIDTLVSHDKNDMYSFIYKYIIPYTDLDKRTKFKGFKYFTPDTSHDIHIMEAPKFYYTALYNEQIIGVLKGGIYGFKPDYYHAIAYVDVHEDFKRKGIATLLFKNLKKDFPNTVFKISDYATVEGLSMRNMIHRILGEEFIIERQDQYMLVNELKKEEVV